MNTSTKRCWKDGHAPYSGTHCRACAGERSVARVAPRDRDVSPWRPPGIFCPDCRKPVEHGESYVVFSNGSVAWRGCADCGESRTRKRDTGASVDLGSIKTTPESAPQLLPTAFRGSALGGVKFVYAAPRKSADAPSATHYRSGMRNGCEVGLAYADTMVEMTTKDEPDYARLSFPDARMQADKNGAVMLLDPRPGIRRHPMVKSVGKTARYAFVAYQAGTSIRICTVDTICVGTDADLYLTEGPGDLSRVSKSSFGCFDDSESVELVPRAPSHHPFAVGDEVELCKAFTGGLRVLGVIESICTVAPGQQRYWTRCMWEGRATPFAMRADQLKHVGRDIRNDEPRCMCGVTSRGERVIAMSCSVHRHEAQP